MQPLDYEALRNQVRAGWRRRGETPYFNEVEVFFEVELGEEAHAKKAKREELTKDY